MAKQERKHKTSLGVLFWIAAILLVLVVFLFNRRNIEQVMERTGLVEIINQRIGVESDGSGDQNSGTGSLPDDDSSENLATNSSTEEDENARDSGSGEEDDDSPAADQDEEDTGSQQQTTEDAADGGDSPSTPDATRDDDQADPAQTGTTAEDPGTRTRDYLVHLVSIDDEGNISLEGISRQVSFVDSPLTRTLETLISQPAESADGRYLNLIPPGSRLLGVSIRNSVAFIDMSEEFRFNPMGAQGQRLQLEQIVFTATQFPTVQAVQFLIEGENLDFLGGEGIYIGSPLSRSDFE